MAISDLPIGGCCATFLQYMASDRRRTLTPSQQRRSDAVRPEPFQWGEWLTIAVVITVAGAGVLWFGLQVVNFAKSSPMARIITPSLSELDLKNQSDTVRSKVA